MDTTLRQYIQMATEYNRAFDKSAEFYIKEHLDPEGVSLFEPVAYLDGNPAFHLSDGYVRTRQEALDLLKEFLEEWIQQEVFGILTVMDDLEDPETRVLYFPIELQAMSSFIEEAEKLGFMVEGDNLD